MGYREVYESWITDPYFDDATKQELLSIKDDDNEIRERFYTDLEFGTAGLRGIIGAGTNRMNIYVVRKATQGLANYIIRQGTQDMGVAISYDSRRMSREFADEAALCLAANGIRAYVSDRLRPTPELSFAVRQFGCTAGINITASHNPPNYNGYKVYWADGAQITPPNDTGIMAEVKAITDYSAVLTMNREEAEAAGLYRLFGSEIDDAYIARLKEQVKNPELIREYGDEITIVYSPLHGTGNIPARRILKEIGFNNVYVVPEQELPDGEFPTVSYPNPESDEAFVMGLELAEKVGADIVLATDPDADRLGVRVKDSDGVYHTLTGNMTGCLLAEYTISQTAEKSGLPEDGAMVKTIVSTNLADAIAKYYNIDLIECLTGFKYIGQVIHRFETTGKGTYLFGFEESYGCLIGTHARDKDGIVASMALCEAAAYYRSRGMNLWDAMLEMYDKYGYYKDDIQTVSLDGIEGLTRISSALETLRNDPPEEIGGYRILSYRDYRNDTIRDAATGEVRQTGLPSSNVLYFDMEDDAWVCVRPSGTEPKIKFYYGVKGTSFENAEIKSGALGRSVTEMIDKIL